MDINSIVDKLNNELDKLNTIKKENNIDTNSFFTNNEKYNDDFSFDDTDVPNNVNNSNNNLTHITSSYNYSNITPDDETVSLVKIKEQHLLNIQNILKKSIRISLKSFLISISLSFLNLFI